MISLNNQFLATETEPRVTITDDEGNSVSFGRGGDYDRIYEINLSADVDSVSWQCDMSFRNHEDMPSLDPNSETSKFGVGGSEADQLMSEYHRVEVEVTKDGGSNYLTVFEGYVGEVLGTRTVDGNDIIDFGTYDLSQPLRDQPILEDAPNQPYEYHDIDAIACANKILEDNGFDLNVNEDASDNPKKTVTEYRVKNTNVWDALTEIFDQTGYKLMFRYHSGNFVLAVVDPGRGVVGSEDVDLTFDNGATSPDDDGYSGREVTNSGKDVRTKVTVFYNHRDTGERKRVTVSDDTARQEWGLPDPGNENAEKQHRWMVLKEDDKSLIDTETEAESYASMALGDLKTPSPDTAIDTKYTVPGLQPWDVVEGGFAGDYTVQVGVTSINYSFGTDNQIGSSTIKGAAFRIIGSPKYWLNKGKLPDDIEAMKGDRKAPPKPSSPPRLERTTYVDGSGTTRVKVICYGEHNPAWDVSGYQFRYRVRNTDTEKVDEWKYPDQVKNPQKTITGLEVAKNLKLEVQYSAIDWENTEWSGLPGDSPYSDTGTISLYVDIMPPSAPSNLTATAGPEQIKLEWTSPDTNKDGSDCTDLNYHYVYIRSGSAPDKDNYDSRQKVDGEGWTYNSTNINTTYHFGITAVDNSGNEGKMSSTTSQSPNAKVGDGETPDVPTGLSVDSNTVDHQEDGTVYAIIKLGWDANSESDLKGYKVALSENDSDWDVIDTVDTNEYTVKPLKPNVTYYFRIASVDTEQNTSSWTSSVSTTTAQDTTPPSTPSWASPAIDEKLGQVIAHWQPVSANDLSYYKVTVDEGNDGSFEDTYRINATDFTVYGSGGTTYAIKVKAVDTSGNESNWSTEQTGTAESTAPSDIGTGSWAFDGTFSASDNDTVAWSSGDLKIPNDSDSPFSISADNTGNMSVPTYIYFDKDVSTTAFQTSTSASDSVGANKILICVANDVAGSKDAEFQVFSGTGNVGISKLITADVIAANTITANEVAANTITASQIATNTITASQIAADTVTANEIAANTITASEINTDAITADEADLSNIFAQNITVTGTIQSDDYSSGTAGWKIGDSGVAEFNDVTVRGKIILEANSEAGWSYITDDDSNKPDDNATVGADWDSNLANIPDRHTDSATSGLNLTSSYLGYYDGSNWKAYINSSGTAMFKNDLTVGDTGTSNYMQYDVSAGTLTVKGNIDTNSISVDSGQVEIGPDVLSDGSAGLYVAEGGGIEIADANGQTIFNSDSEFMGQGVFLDSVTDTNSVDDFDEKLTNLTEYDVYVIHFQVSRQTSSGYGMLRMRAYQGASEINASDYFHDDLRSGHSENIDHWPVGYLGTAATEPEDAFGRIYLYARGSCGQSGTMPGMTGRTTGVTNQTWTNGHIDDTYSYIDGFRIWWDATSGTEAIGKISVWGVNYL